MSITIDIDWLKSRAKGPESIEAISQIGKWRRDVLESNRFVDGDQMFNVNLAGQTIWLRECSAFSSIEVYEEIFKRNDHFLVPGFSAKNAELIVDVGANEGFYALKVKQQNPGCRMVCIEPNPYSFEILKNNVRSNKLKDVVLVNKAMGDQEKEIVFDCLKEVGAICGNGLRTVERKWLDEEWIEQKTVDMATLDSTLSGCDGNKIDVLKIDVEGMELEVLQGSTETLGRTNRIVVERHSRELRDKVVELLTELEFKLVFEEDPLFQRYYGDLYFVAKHIDTKGLN